MTTPHARLGTSVLVAVVLGAAIGTAWALWAPAVHGVAAASGAVAYPPDQAESLFRGVVGFVVASAVGGIATGVLLFRRGRRTRRGLWVALGAAGLAVVVAAGLGQAIADARFDGPVGAGPFTAAPGIRLAGAVFLTHASGRGSGPLPWIASWVALTVWPAATALWCVLVVLVRGSHDDAGE